MKESVVRFAILAHDPDVGGQPSRKQIMTDGHSRAALQWQRAIEAFLARPSLSVVSSEDLSAATS